MSSTQYAISLKTNRLISKSTANYKKLKKMGLTKEIGDSDEATKPTKPSKPQPTPEVKQQEEQPTPQQPEQPEFNELQLQHRMSEITSDMVKTNLKEIVKSQKLSDKEYDILLKRMLYKKLCLVDPTEPTVKPKKTKTKKKKMKFRVITPPQSESESESESE